MNKLYPYGHSKTVKRPYLIIKNKIIYDQENQINNLKPALFKTDIKKLYGIVNYLPNYLSYF